MFKDVCPVRAAMVSDADNSDTDTWDDAAMSVPAVFFNSDDESDLKDFNCDMF